jgi:hypothetical protein
MVLKELSPGCVYRASFSCLQDTGHNTRDNTGIPAESETTTALLKELSTGVLFAVSCQATGSTHSGWCREKLT